MHEGMIMTDIREPSWHYEPRWPPGPTAQGNRPFATRYHACQYLALHSYYKAQT